MAAPHHGPGLKEGYEIKRHKHKVTVTPSFDMKPETKKLPGSRTWTTNFDTDLLKTAAREPR